MSIDKINNIVQKSAQRTDTHSTKNTAAGNYTIGSGETLYSLMKKLNFKNESEIRAYLKLSGTASLKKGQSVKLPSTKLETTMMAIARKYNISLKELLALNPQISDPTRLHRGENIIVPIRPFSKSAEIEPKVPENKNTEIHKNVSKSTTPPKALAKNLPDAKPQKEIVVPNFQNELKDNIEQRQNSIRMFLKNNYNNVINNKKINTNNRKNIPQNAKFVKGVNRDLSNNPYLKITKNQPYIVKKGDNFDSIAKRHHIQTRTLLDFNNIHSKHTLHVGDVIKIPDTIEPKNIKNLDNVAKATGLSKSYLLKLKIMEDGDIGENKFHNKVYYDRNNNPTIGIGHLVTKAERSKYMNKTLTDSEVCTLFAKDIMVQTDNLRSILGAKYYDRLPQPIKDALVDYSFNRGIEVVGKQTKLLEYLRKGDYTNAIGQFNVDYSTKKLKNGERKKVFMSGLSKRRLFEMSQVCKIYNGKIPQRAKAYIQNMYNRGLFHINNEYKSEKSRHAAKTYFTKEIKAMFGNLLKYY